LKNERIETLKRYQEKAREKDIDLPLLHYAGLGDLIKIIANNKKLTDLMPKQFEYINEKQDTIIEMRNSIAHVGNMLVNSRDDLKPINSNLHSIISVINATYRL